MLDLIECSILPGFICLGISFYHEELAHNNTFVQLGFSLDRVVTEKKSS